MGRIDEALRRAGADLGKPPLAAVVAAQTAFVAPWAIGRDNGNHDPQAAPPTAAPAQEAAGRSRDLLGVPQTTAPRAFDPEYAHRLVIAPEPNPTLVEQFRGLAATLHRTRAAIVDRGTSLKVIMVTSASPGEGKTLTATNLALTLSESYRQQVLLIDADLRRPSLMRLCQLPDSPGLSEGLKSPVEQKLETVQFTEMLTVLPAGRPDSDPMSSLTSSRMRRILDEAAARFDWVVVDAPPVGPVADAGLLASMVDAALLVIRAETTGYAMVQKAIDALGRDRIIGVVLNAVPDTGKSGDGDYDHYHS